MKKEIQVQELVKNEEGRVLPPLILYALGVPGFLCLFIWFFFFRG